MIFLLFWTFIVLLPQPEYSKYIIATNKSDCLLVHDPSGQVELAHLIEYAVRQGFYSIQIQGGTWSLSDSIVLKEINRPLWIHGDPRDEPVVLISKPQPAFSIYQTGGIVLENLVIEGGIELDQTFDIAIQSVVFRKTGVHFKGRRCNQPNECTSYNRQISIEDCLFENCEKGIYAERLESSTIRNNRFVGERNTSCERGVGIELDGSNEDLDRPLEYGHSKANLVRHNVFEQEFITGIRVKDSLSNIFQENQFYQSFRAFEFLEGARHNQILNSYIGYLSQNPTSAACQAPCGIYVGPATLNNIFINNFFEQNFELQFFERHRNKTFVIDESANRNVFRSDFLRIVQ